MKIVFLLVLSGLFFACSSNQQIARDLDQNPDLIFDVLRKNPEKFMATLREAAQSEQKNEMAKMAKARDEQMEKDLKNPRSVKIDNQRLIFGEGSAPIAIVKYADFQCPACRMGFLSLEEIKKKYSGKVKVIHKNIPLPMHAQAQAAAEIYEALLITDKSLAQKFYKKAYETQREWGSDEKLWEMAKKMGVNKDKILSELKKGVVASRIKEDLAEHEALGFEGTPAYMINGVAMYGAQSAEDMSDVIEKLLKKK